MQPKKVVLAIETAAEAATCKDYLQVSSRRGSAQNMCDECDGCGWVEGGRVLQTKCKPCNGTGIIKVIDKTKRIPGRRIK